MSTKDKKDIEYTPETIETQTLSEIKSKLKIEIEKEIRKELRDELKK